MSLDYLDAHHVEVEKFWVCSSVGEREKLLLQWMKFSKDWVILTLVVSTSDKTAFTKIGNCSSRGHVGKLVLDKYYKKRMNKEDVNQGGLGDQ